MKIVHCIRLALTVHKTNREVRVCPFSSTANGVRKHTMFLLKRKKEKKKRNEGELIKQSTDFVILRHEHWERTEWESWLRSCEADSWRCLHLNWQFYAWCPKHGGLCIKQTMPGETNGQTVIIYICTIV